MGLVPPEPPVARPLAEGERLRREILRARGQTLPSPPAPSPETDPGTTIGGGDVWKLTNALGRRRRVGVVICPFHRGRHRANPPSCYVNWTAGTYFCVGCGRVGDVATTPELRAGRRRRPGGVIAVASLVVSLALAAAWCWMLGFDAWPRVLVPFGFVGLAYGALVEMVLDRG